MEFFGKTIDGSRSLYLDELTVTWNADILATSLFSKPAIFDTTLKITETLTLGDTNSVTLSPNFITTPYSLFLPPTQGTSNTFLENNGSGVLTWRSSTSLPYVTSVALSAPSFLTVSGSPITSAGTLALTYSGTPLPVLNGGTGVTTSTGTGNNVLSNNAYLTGADLTDTFLDGTVTLAAPLSILNGGTGVTTSTGSGSNVLSNNADLIGADLTDTFLDGTLTLDTPLSTSNGGTGLSTIGANGQFLASNGTNLYWESANQIGIMRYKQKYYPYIYVTPPAGMQLWFGGSAFITSNIDFRTLYPVEGAQAGLSLTYGYEENFGRFVNEYPFPVIAEISYSASRFQPSFPVIETGAGVQYDAPLAIFTTFLNGGTAFYIEKNNNGDALATSSSNSGVFCTASVTIILQPNDFFQLRGSTTSTITGLINVESEIFIQLKGINATPAVFPAAPGSGTVTSVNINSSEPFFSVGGGPITTSGTLSIGLSGTALPIRSGGTGLTAVGTTGQVLTSNGSTLTWQTPSPPGTGTVTSVSATTPSFLTVSGSPITSSGTLALTYSGTALPTLNGGTGLTAVGTTGQVLTSNGSTLTWQTPSPPGTGTVTSVSASVPDFLTVSGSPITTSGTLALTYSGTALPTLNGGTGLTAVGTSGQVLTSNGSTLTWQTPSPPGTGTVTSVSASVPSFLTVSGSPITTAGTLALTYSGTALPVLNGGTGVTTSTGSGNNVLSTNALLVDTVLSGTTIVTGQGINVDGGSGPNGWSSLFSNTPTNAGLSSSGVSNGFNFGWNVSGSDADNVMTYYIGPPVLANARLDICSWDDSTRTTTLSINRNGGVTFGSNLYPTIQGTSGQVLTTNGSGTLSWQTPSSPGTGTVTSVSASVPSFLSIAGSPITTSGTLAIGLSGTALPTTSGGTGLTTVGTNGQVLRSNGTILSWATPTSGTVTSVSATVPSFLSITGSPITASGTLAISYSGTALPVLNGGTGSTTATGTGAVVLQDAATMGALTVTSGLQILGFGGATGWTSILSNIGTGNNSGIRGDGGQNGFNFGWNVSGGEAESIITYGTLGFGRLDICSWDGTTRTTTLSINNTGGVTFGSNLYPTIQGTSGQVLTTNGSGTLSWQTPSSPGTGTVTSVSASVPSFLSIAGSPITTSGTLAITYSTTPLPVANGGTGVTTSTGTLNNVLSNNPTLNDTILNGITTATRGLNVLGGTGSTGWTSILSGIGTGNNSGIRGDGIQNGFNFGWNVSGGQAESIITYGTLGFGRLDICSWNGTTRTTTLSINSSGVVSIPLGAIISSGLTVNGDSLYTSSLTINGITRTPQINGSGTSGDLTITSTRNLATNVSGSYTLNSGNINLNSANPVFSNSKRIDNTYGHMILFLPETGVDNNVPTSIPLTITKTRGFTLNQPNPFTLQNTTGQSVLVTANFSVQRNFNLSGQSQAWIQTSSSEISRYGFIKGAALDYLRETAIFSLDEGESFSVYIYQDSGLTVNFNGTSFNTSGNYTNYLFISYAGI